MIGDLIGNEFNNIIYGACLRAANALNIPESDIEQVQLRFSLRHNFEDFIALIEKYKEEKNAPALNAVMQRLKKLKFDRISDEELPVPTYHLTHQHIKALSEVSFMEVLGRKIDFKGYSVMVPPFIKSSLLRLHEEHELGDKEQLLIFAIPRPAIPEKNIRKSVLLSLYRFDIGTQKIGRHIKFMSLKDLLNGVELNEEDLEQEQSGTEPIAQPVEA